MTNTFLGFSSGSCFASSSLFCGILQHLRDTLIQKCVCAVCKKKKDWYSWEGSCPMNKYINKNRNTTPFCFSLFYFSPSKRVGSLLLLGFAYTEATGRVRRKIPQEVRSFKEHLCFEANSMYCSGTTADSVVGFSHIAFSSFFFKLYLLRFFFSLKWVLIAYRSLFCTNIQHAASIKIIMIITGCKKVNWTVKLWVFVSL